METEEPLLIGEVATRAGVIVETVRFYEREKLIPTPRRRPSGYREYSSDTIQRIRFIRRAKELGFTLEEIRELLALRRRASNSCDHVRTRAQAKIADVERRIDALTRIRDALETLASECSDASAAAPCPILSALDREEDRDAER